MAMTRFFGSARRLNTTIQTTGITPGPAIPCGPYPGVACSVYNAGTQVLALIYAIDDVSVPKPNPFSVNVDGQFFFFGPAASYDLYFTSGVPPTTIAEVQVPSYTTAMFPAADPNLSGRLAQKTDGALGLWLDNGTAWVAVSASSSTYTAHGVAVGAGTSTLTIVGPSATVGVPLVGAGSGADPTFTTLTAAGGGTGLATITAHGIMLGQGTSAVSTTAVGASNTVLHGNTAADPTYSAVVEADLTLADNTTDDVSTARHGFAPKAPNDATKFLDGTGAYSVPAGAGGYDYVQLQSFG